jgi:hypothetical protein
MADPAQAIPEGFEPVASANDNQPNAMPEGFEPVPQAELKINPNPPAFSQRLAQGSRIQERLHDIMGAAKEGFGTSPLGIPEDTGSPTANALLSPNAPFPLNQIRPAAKAYDFLTRTLNAGIQGTAEVAGQTVSALGASQGMSERAKEDVSNFGTWLMSEGGMRYTTAGDAPHAPLVDAGDGNLARIVTNPDGTATTHVVGEYPPKPIDFDAAATNIAAKAGKADEAVVKQKLFNAWETEGKHPAEVAADAETDAFLRHDLSSAAANPTDIPSLASHDGQPLSVPGKIVADLKSLSDQSFDVGRWVQNQLAPIATGDDAMIASTTKYLSSIRRVAWDWGWYDKKITDSLSLEQQKAVWRAMDDEAVMARSGEKSEHIGIATLSPEEQAIAKELSQHAITTRMQMIDRGMATDEGMGPFYVPRVFSGIEKGESVSLGPVTRLRESTGSMQQRKYLTAEESEAAAQAKFGPNVKLVDNIRTLPMVLAKQQKAIAAHDFMDRVRKLGQDIGDPQMIEGDVPKGDEAKWFTVPDSDLKTFSPEGSTPAPLHIKMEWASQFKAIMDTKFNAWDKVVVETKNRPMSLIMNSPFIHDSVVFSKALPSNPGNLLSFKFLRHGPQLLADQKFMGDMIDSGLVLWGRRAGFKQDVTSMMEGPQIEPGRSLTAKILGYVPDLFSEKAGTATKRGIDRMGEFVHDKLLGEQVQKLQASLAYDFRETLRKKFPEIPDEALNVLAAHEGNRFGGSLPAEAMSAFSRGFTNAVLFSRQFTLGNLGILKDAAKGPPEYVMARVRDMLGPEGAEGAENLRLAAKRHAFSVVMLDLGMYAVGNSMIQTGVNLASGTPMSDEVQGYWSRLQMAAKRIEEHPFSPSSYLTFFPSLSPTFYHEPGKEGRILLGNRADGTAIYGRSVLGRMGEDYIGLLTHPSSYLLTKMAPLPRAFMEVLGNKDGFDRPIYDPKALSGGDVWQAWNIAKHFVEAELPMQQINGVAALSSGTGDFKDAISTLGPYAPPPLTVTASQGYPGGPAAGVVAGHKRDERTAQDLQMSNIKDMVINKNDIYGARQQMTQLGVNRGLQNYLIKNWQHPGLSKLNSRTLAEFYQHASPVEIEILNTMRAH